MYSKNAFLDASFSSNLVNLEKTTQKEICWCSSVDDVSNIWISGWTNTWMGDIEHYLAIMIWNSWLIFRLFPNPFEEVSELQIFVNICPNICQYLPIFVQIFVLLYEVLYLHLQYTLSLLTSRDLTLPFTVHLWQ